MINAMSVDLEDWFCPLGSQNKRNPKDWDDYEIRIEIGTNILLELFMKYNIKATFFILAWLAERRPALIELIHSQGHEIASHGYNHVAINSMSCMEFHCDLEKSLKIINSITGENVKGYRAPVFSITRSTLWALDTLSWAGIEYDSSVYPYNLHPEYGISGFNLDVSMYRERIIEVPLSCAVYGKIRIPCSGGAYFRLYPYPLTRKFLNKINDEGRPFVFYIHPWELDKNQPRLNLNFKDKLRHYHNLNHVQVKLDNLLRDFKFDSIYNMVKSCEDFD